MYPITVWVEKLFRFRRRTHGAPKYFVILKIDARWAGFAAFGPPKAGFVSGGMPDSVLNRKKAKSCRPKPTCDRNAGVASKCPQKAHGAAAKHDVVLQFRHSACGIVFIFATRPLRRRPRGRQMAPVSFIILVLARKLLVRPPFEGSPLVRTAGRSLRKCPATRLGHAPDKRELLPSTPTRLKRRTR